MNKRVHLFVFLLLAFFSYTPMASAQDRQSSGQNGSDWQPIFLLVNGGNTMDGVEASFQLNKCNSGDVIYIKFVNHNEYPVKAEWFDGIFTQELKWVNEERIAAKKSITIPAKGESKGECLKSSDSKLIVKIKDFIKDKNNFKRYSASQLTITAIK